MEIVSKGDILEMKCLIYIIIKQTIEKIHCLREYSQSLSECYVKLSVNS